MRATALLLMLASLGCQAVVDPGIEYVDCLPDPDGTYVELFDKADQQPGAERCWKMENLSAPGYYRGDGEDLIIHPPGQPGARWLETEQAPLFFQHLQGDFLLVTRAETVSGRSAGDHCLNGNEASGLAVRQQSPLAWSTLLVRPALNDEELANPDLCGDNPTVPPTAQVVAQSYGFGDDRFDAVSEVGFDAEADIALCRKDHLLFYFIQELSTRPASTRHNLKEGFAPLDVGFGPLDVGLTATAAAGRNTLPEGHFPWLYLKVYDEEPISESCLLALDEFMYPEME